MTYFNVFYFTFILPHTKQKQVAHARTRRQPAKLMKIVIISNKIIYRVIEQKSCLAEVRIILILLR